MGTIHQLELIVERLQNCPRNLVRVELTMFRDQIESNPGMLTALQQIILSNEAALGGGPKAATLVNSIGSSGYSNLRFANTPALRAALGYQVCTVLLDSDFGKDIDFDTKVVKLGSHYASSQNPLSNPDNYSHAIKVFSMVFLRPLVSYLDGAMQTEERILFLLSRYKQRREWFTDAADIDVGHGDREDGETGLKKDILRYLFDNGVEFSVESQTPPGGGKVDVLAVLPDLGPLPIEVKVHDGENRNAVHVSRGIAQAADYGRKFNSLNAYFFVYNIAKDKVVTISGDRIGPNVTRRHIGGIYVHSVVANLQITLPSSKASELQTIEIPVPTPSA